MHQALGGMSAPAGASPMDKGAPARVSPGAPVDAEVPFSFEEIFFSRTDEKGHIIFGNTVFQRTTFYSWDELRGKPHNIVRHPDMPKAVYWLLWNTIQKGEPTGAYIKNKAKDGRYYWVYAIVTPVKGGYLSVRIKPSSPLLDTVAKEYAALVAAEQERRLKPADSAKIFLERLAALGFVDYSAFMASALSQEAKARDEKLGRPQAAAAAHFEGLIKAARQLLGETDGLAAEYAAHRFVPYNLRVQAAHLGQAGASIAVISENYDELSGAINSMMADFNTAVRKLFAAINNGLFLYCAAKIQTEMQRQFEAEFPPGVPAPEDEIILLEDQRRTYEKRAAEGLGLIAADAGRFDRICADLNRAAASLETTRIMGKVESARIGCSTTGLGDLLYDLERYQLAIMQGLQRMLTINRGIERDARRLERNIAT
jgi:PAS domain S-box-containing protein